MTAVSPAVWGGVLGGVFAVGALLVGRWAVTSRRTSLQMRVLVYLRDLPGPAVPVPVRGGAVSRATSTLAASLDRLLGGSSGIARRLERAGLALTVHEFRLEQLLWGTVGFTAAALPAGAVAARHPERSIPLLILCLVAFVLGMLLRENHLTDQVRRRERLILAEFPVIAELLALAVAAGEGPVAALERIVTRANGSLIADLKTVLAEIRTGTPVATAFDRYAARSGLPVVARFAEGIAIAVERGTPLADVLRAQAADVREAGCRSLIEAGARKEIAMLVPVVLLVLPVVVVFAFWPGLVGLRLVVP